MREKEFSNCLIQVVKELDIGLLLNKISHSEETFVFMTFSKQQVNGVCVDSSHVYVYYLSEIQYHNHIIE